MILWLGKNVSSHVYPEIPGGKSASFGEKYVSYPQLFSLLEVALGIVYVPTPTAKRISAYRRKLEAAINSERFYSASFKLDPIGVAKTLLRWRDELCLAGGGDLSVFAKAESQRLRDLAQVEKAGQPVPMGEAERIDQIIAALTARKTTIDKIVLLDKEAVLPEAYRRLINALKKSGVLFEEFVATAASASGNLSILQQALSSPGTERHKFKLLDESLHIVKAESDALLAEALSRYLQSSPGTHRVIINEHQSQLLDVILSETGEAKQGFGAVSNQRPILQLLPVFISLFWKPLDVYRLLDFLLMPISPIPKSIRFKLSDAVSNQPGIGGRAWLEAMSGADEAETQRVNDFLMLERHGEDAGVPIKYLTEKLRLLERWARAFGQTDREEAASPQLLMLAAQISELVDLLAEMPSPSVTRLELEQLLALVASGGLTSPESSAEASKPCLVTDPAYVLSPVDEIIWFDFTGEELWNSPKSQWFEDEKREIAAMGLNLVDEGLVAKAKAAAAIRAVGHCQKKLIIFQPAKKAGAETTAHPLYELATGRIANIGEVSVAGNTVFAQDLAILPGAGMHAVQGRNLPQPRRFWNIGQIAGLNRQRVESYSSLSGLFYYPHIYVLNTLAKIQSSSLATVSGGAQLLGTIAHDLLQRFVKNEIRYAALDYKNVRIAITAELEKIIEKEAAVFLLPGQGNAREDLVHSVTRSAIELKRLLDDNGFTTVETEKLIEKDFKDGKLKGFIDLIASAPGRDPVIIDLKWGGYKNRRAELENNDALQLMIYSYLAKAKAWPEFAYFIISRATLLASKNTFQGFNALTPAQAESEEEVWKKIEATYVFRKGQLQSGEIEVPLGELNNAEALVADATLLPMPDEANYYDEYGVLTGAGIY